jgi:hypothetical protein
MKFKQFIENKYTGTPFTGWQDRKPDQMAFNSVNSALQHLQGAHPELNQQIEAFKSQFADLWDQIKQKHMGSSPGEF